MTLRELQDHLSRWATSGKMYPEDEIKVEIFIGKTFIQAPIVDTAARFTAKPYGVAGDRMHVVITLQ
jgi:hypothetical protein